MLGRDAQGEAEHVVQVAAVAPPVSGRSGVSASVARLQNSVASAGDSKVTDASPLRSDSQDAVVRTPCAQTTDRSSGRPSSTSTVVPA